MRPSLSPSFRFVGGKGGVGKTTYAAAVALARATAGSRLLLVSTDPVHSVADVLGVRVGARPRRLALAGVTTLTAVAIDADKALARWLARRREALSEILEQATYLDREDVEELLGLAVPGVDELMGLLELERLARARAYDEVVVDMAPTGHALRLLATPAALRRAGHALDVMRAKHRYLSRALAGRVVHDAAEAIIDELSSDGERLEALLRDPDRCRFSWVMLPEAMVVEEAADGLASLAEAGRRVDELIVNRLREAPVEPCRSCQPRFAYEQGILKRLATRFRGMRVVGVAEVDTEPRGAAALLGLLRTLEPYRASAPRRRWKRKTSRRERPDSPPVLAQLAPQERKLLLFAGKGGVGKTTAAASAALLHAAGAPQRRVLLLSVDPAHSLSDVLEHRLGDRPTPLPGVPATLLARELDASRGFDELRESYRSEVERLFEHLHRQSGVDPSYDREALEELIELAPPGLDELMAVVGLVEALLGADGAKTFDLAVVDTAPTAHALRLLEMPELALGWVRAMLKIFLKYRDVVGLGSPAEQLLDLARRLRLLKELLRDRTRSSVIIVTRPEELPLQEGIWLSRRLERAGVSVGAVMVNAVTDGDCSRCRRSIEREHRLLERYLSKLSGTTSTSARRRRVIIHAPAVYPPPSGVESLVRWARGWEECEG